MRRDATHKRSRGQRALRGELEEQRLREQVAKAETGRTSAEPAAGTHLYGVAPVLEAMRAGKRSIEHIVIAEGAHTHRLRELFDLARQANIPVRRATRVELARLVGNEANHQGVVATVAAAGYIDADDLLDDLAARIGTDEPPLAVVLDGVEDPRNLGAIIRTIECAGAHGLLIPERRAVGLTDAVAKSAAGALEHVRVARATNLARLIDEFKERGIWTVGTSGGGEMEYTSWDYTQPCAIFFGSEGAGLHRLVRERCDVRVRIPMRGHIKSLNVSVAAGVVLYEAQRQRRALARAGSL